MAASVQKTTVYLDRDDYRRLKALAAEHGGTPAQMVREAVALYVRGKGKRRRARSIGMGRSGRKDLSERAEELLGGLGRR